ncbi:hypothetical protein HPP92_009465 [Vanilla planifolia]|uniref:B box-type domain-containing protein n=1 Tax=Vanilla planifolia TaxID=51239 RepID=A0A835RA28_VANPL|nr:hypothetical protein HPP92_009465 [Vanilla planifolia]
MGKKLQEIVGADVAKLKETSERLYKSEVLSKGKRKTERSLHCSSRVLTIKDIKGNGTEDDSDKVGSHIIGAGKKHAQLERKSYREQMGREGRLPGGCAGLAEGELLRGLRTHQSLKKNEKNILCLDCCTSICPHCAPSHPSHPLLQVEHVVAQGADLSTILVRFHQSHLAFANLDRLQMDPSDDLGAGSNDQFVSTSVLQDCQTHASAGFGETTQRERRAAASMGASSFRG